MVVSTWFAIAFQAVMMYMMLFTDLTKVSLAEINGITIAFLLVFALLNGVKSITNNIVVPMIADCTDYEYTLSGHFVPGIMGALFSFIDKSFSALGTGFVGIALSMTRLCKSISAGRRCADTAVKIYDRVLLLCYTDSWLVCHNFYYAVLPAG